MRSLLVSYFMCAAGLFTPLAGLHRFYLDKPISGLCYLFTWGFFGIGTIIDLIRMPRLLDEYNLQRFYLTHLPEQKKSSKSLSSPERAILRCANDNNGLVTIPMVALASGRSMAESKLELDRLYKEGFCSKDVDEEGNEIYYFRGLKAKAALK